jgi:dienelactone hydrolase
MPVRRRHRYRLGKVVSCLAGLSAAILASCATSVVGPVRIHVDHPIALMDVALSITVSGLQPKAHVTIGASAVDCNETRYKSAATFTADGVGHLNLATVAPKSGDYHAADSMGLIENMRPTTGTGTSFAFCVPQNGFNVTLTAVVADRKVAQVTLRRLWSLPGVVERQLRPAADGFFGDYLSPPPGSARHPAVLVLGGSEGGLGGHTEAAVLASHGYPALALAYFAEPGIPSTLQNIPLEYFAKALTFLAGQPGVDPDHLVVDGASRGGEVALLLGVYYPNLVHAVIAQTTTSLVECGFNASQQCDGAAWTFHGAPLPYSENFHSPQASGPPDVMIPVEKINGPILHDCGGRDLLIPSCPFGIEIQDRLNAAHFPFAHRFLTYPDAGHLVNAGVPDDPIYIDSLGGTLEANELAVAEFWPQQLNFLAGIGK